jgi:hypothetical protein
LTALEYKNNKWSLYEYAKDEIARNTAQKLNKKELKALKKGDSPNFWFDEFLKEFEIQKPLK